MKIVFLPENQFIFLIFSKPFVAHFSHVLCLYSRSVARYMIFPNKKWVRERERERKSLQFTAGVTPVIPAFGNDNVVHISVGKDNPGEGTPCPPKEQSS